MCVCGGVGGGGSWNHLSNFSKGALEEHFLEINGQFV